MMIGERNHTDPTVHVPPWSLNHPTVDTSSFSSPSSVNGVPLKLNGNAEDYYPLLGDALTAAFQRYLPSNDVDGDGEIDGDSDFPSDAYSCDDFRMFEFKVRKCARGRSHDWTECPYAHPGEKARRRDPRRFHYSGTACPDFRKGNCKKGDGCEYAHGVFECWLHPARYRTQPCKDGTNCRRRVCFFAHTPDQLRVLSPRTPTGSSESYDGSPSRLVLEAKGFPFISSLESVSPQSESPPLSPMTNSLSRSPNSLSRSSGSVNELVASLRQLQLNKVKSMPSSYGVPIGSPGFGSSRVPITRPDFCSLPSTPNRAGLGFMDLLDNQVLEEEPVMERVESGRNLRTKMFERLSKENPLDRSDLEASNQGPDVGWVSELIQ